LQNSSANQHSEKINGVGSKLNRMLCIQKYQTAWALKSDSCELTANDNTIAVMNAYC